MSAESSYPRAIAVEEEGYGAYASSACYGAGDANAQKARPTAARTVLAIEVPSDVYIVRANCEKA